MTQPFIVGLTGNIGSGKSTVAEFFRNFGAQVVSGDALGREVLQEDHELQRDMLSRWGEQIRDASGAWNRRRIGELVFSSPSDAKWLTMRTFPGIHQKWRAQVSTSLKTVLVLDAALIFEWGIEGEFDLLVSVICDDDVAASRLGVRFTIEEFRLRRSNQIAVREMIEKSDVVIENNGTRIELEQKVRTLWQERIAPHLV